MANGNWIKLYRSLSDSAVFGNERLLKVWIWCLLRATYREYDQLVGRQLVPLKPGQFIFGRKKAASELDMPESSVRDYMKLLESMGNIAIKSTNKYSIVTVCQWDLYQSGDGEHDSKPPTDQPTDGQQMNTNKKYKKYKEKIYSSQVTDLLAYWNGKKIIVHKETEAILKQVEKGLKKHSFDDVKIAIDRYSQVYHDGDYFYKHKWTLPKFLSQSNGVPDFLDEGIRWINYNQEVQTASNEVKTSKSGGVIPDFSPPKEVHYDY